MGISASTKRNVSRKVLRRASDRTPLGSIIGSIERAFDLGDYDLLAELLDRNILAAWFGLRPERLGLIIATMTEAGAPVNLVLRTIATLLASPGSAHAIGEQLSDSAPEAGTLDELAALSQRMFALRLQGRPVEAMQFSASLDRRSGISYPLFDTQNGWGLFAPVQFGVTAMLAGDFSAALASFTQARMHVIVPHLAFLTRDAYVKSALIEALYGDAERASALLDDASRVLRTESWAEGGLDACAVIAGSLLPSRAPAEALRMLESVPLHEVGEMWPFHAAAVHRALVAAGYQEEARRRIEMFEGMPLPHQEGQGYTGSVLLLCRIADSVAHGDLLDARERIGRADEVDDDPHLGKPGRHPAQRHARLPQRLAGARLHGRCRPAASQRNVSQRGHHQPPALAAPNCPFPGCAYEPSRLPSAILRPLTLAPAGPPLRALAATFSAGTLATHPAHSCALP